MDNQNIFKPPKGQHKLRTYRTSMAGDFYFITICVEDKKSILANDRIANVIFESLDFLEKERMIKLICSVIMPDHIHLVIHLMERKSLSELMRSFKSFTARNINKILEKRGKLWQNQYYEHKIRAEESLWKIAKYCYENPVRKGLIDDPGKYPYWKFCPGNLIE